jgi:hypothetical protein
MVMQSAVGSAHGLHLPTFEEGRVRSRAVSARPREEMFEMDLSILSEGLRSAIKLVILQNGV